MEAMLLSLKRSPGKLAIDAGLFAVAWIGAWLVRFEGVVDPNYHLLMAFSLPLVVGLKVVIFAFLGCYRSVWRYTGLSDLLVLGRAVAVSLAVLVLLAFFFMGTAHPKLPRWVPIHDAFLTLILCGGVRLLPRVLRESLSSEAKSHLPKKLLDWLVEEPRTALPRTLVVGAGDAGETVVRLLRRNELMGYRPVAIVDDDPRKEGLSIHGISVLGSTEEIPAIARRLDVQIVLIAIPSARPSALRRIAALCRKCELEIRMVPDLKSLLSGKLSLSDIKELDTEALLGREKVDLRIEETASYLRERRILITGAGGSIGSELCRQILPFQPSELILFGRGENSIFKIHQELYRTGTPTLLHQVIGDVINRRKLEGVFRDFRPEIVFHAGADKHVPLMELNPDEAVLNNILGTRNVLETANDHHVDRVVCISTDKAVNPTSVMGCCKRVAELLIQSTTYENTKAVAVRFGNVLGSRGSIIPVFEEQIEKGGPVTVTDRDVVRYFMTIPEAVQLVIQAGVLAQGGEIFILEMGDPVRIEELAENMIRLHGYEPGVEIPIQITGLRPGEKLREELMVEGEVAVRTEHPKILCVKPGRSMDANGELSARIAELTALAVEMDEEGIRRALREVVPEYRPYAGPSVTSVKVKKD